MQFKIYNYYNEENIVETYNQGDNKYIFQVQGSEDYEVVVKIDKNGEILKRYKKITCKKNQEEKINELSTLYRKRPAFVDELSKIK